MEQVVQHTAADQSGDDGFTHVGGDDQEGIFGAVDAVEVCETGVAAAVLTHVIPYDEMGNHDGAVDAAQKIGYQQHNRRGENVKHQLSSSPFWRMVRMTGVPSSPNTPRIWFSR